MFVWVSTFRLPFLECLVAFFCSYLRWGTCWKLWVCGTYWLWSLLYADLGHSFTGKLLILVFCIFPLGLVRLPRKGVSISCQKSTRLAAISLGTKVGRRVGGSQHLVCQCHFIPLFSHAILTFSCRFFSNPYSSCSALFWKNSSGFCSAVEMGVTLTGVG